MYQYYLQRGFHIKTVHADGERAHIKPLIESMPGGPMVNLASANEQENSGSEGTMSGNSAQPPI
jgi:hypothetical protein